LKHRQTYKTDIPASLCQHNKDLLTVRGVKFGVTPLKNKVVITGHGAKDYSHPTKKNKALLTDLGINDSRHSTEKQSCNHR
jgi:hypothetical protein